MSTAFSVIADTYDTTFTETAVGALQRTAVWKRLAPLKGNLSVLEINCGTGADAVWMAQRGWEVLATDVSMEMVEITRKKIEKNGLHKLASTQVCAFSEIGQLTEGPFDLIFSNFGGLNCIPPEDLAALAAVLDSKLKPGGHFIAVVMGRFCFWETLYFLLKLKPTEAFRRLKRGPVNARLDEKTAVPTWYYSSEDFRTSFARFSLKSVFPIGLWLPPSYLDPFFAKRPRLLQILHFMENKLAPSWLARASDHFIIRLSKP